MSIFVRSSRPAAENRDGGGDRVLEAYMRAQGLGADRRVAMNITPDTAMKSSVVAACVLKIENLSMLELHSERKVDGQYRASAGGDAKLLTEPSADLSPMAWRRQVLNAWLTRGTAFGMVARWDGYGFPAQIELIPADCVTVRQTNRSSLARWAFKVDGQEIATIADGGPLWVAPGLHHRTGSPVGISPIEMAIGSIRLGLLAEDFGTSWFDGGGQPSGVIESDQRIEDTVARSMSKRFADRLRASREPVTLGSGLKYRQISVAANESQFLETLERNVATIARFFLMPPEDIGGSSGNAMTYANIDTRQLQKVLDVFGPWIAHLEDTLTRITPRPQVVRADLGGLIRPDVRTRTEVDKTDVLAGIRTRDEVRAGRGLDPLPDGAGAVVPPFKLVSDPASPAAREDDRA